MIFRAIFWIGWVAVLMPHEPDLGFGRPGTKLAALTQDSIGGLIQPADTCPTRATACAAGFAILENFQAFAVRSLNQVRADIEINGVVVSARAGRSTPIGGVGDLNPLTDADTFLAVMQNLRPYPE